MDTDKVLIISMEKAGSTTVMHAIRSAGFEVGRLHRHNKGEVNTAEYDKFVVMVREPVARAISNHFETGMEISIEYEISYTLDFFDDCVLPVTGIDVLWFQAWPPGTGWAVMDDLLIIKTENIDSGLAGGLSVLLGEARESFEIIHHPQGCDRFGPEYEQFIREVKFDSGYLTAVSKSKYCQKLGYGQEVMKWATAR